MGAQREYTAIFSIGGRLLGSFKGAMGAAQARMKATQRAALAIGRAFKTAMIGLVSLSGVFAGLAIGKIFRDIFGGATDEALEAHRRVRNLTSAFMRLQKVQATAKPLATAQEQVHLLQQQTEQLGKQSVLHEEVYESVAAGLARFKVYPKEIADILPSLGELLVELKDVNASEEDGMELGKQFGLAISSGNVRAIRTTGILNKEQLKLFQKLTSSADRYKFIAAALTKYQGTIARAMKTPEGRIQLLRNYIRTLRHEIGEEILPIQAEMADAWRQALPQLRPLLISSIRALGRAAKWAGKQVTDLVNALTKPVNAQGWLDLADAIRDVGRAFQGPPPTVDYAERLMKAKPPTVPLIAEPVPEKSLGAMIGDFLSYGAGKAASMLRQDAKDIAAVRAEYMKFRVEMDALQVKATALWDKLQTVPVLGPVMREIKTFGEFMKLTLTDPNAAIKAVWQELIVDSITTMKNMWSSFSGDVKAHWEILKSAGVAVFDAFKNYDWEGIGTRVTAIFTRDKETIIAAIDAIGKAIVDLIMWPIRKVEEAWARLTGAITGFAPTAGGGAGGGGSWLSRSWQATKNFLGFGGGKAAAAASAYYPPGAPDKNLIAQRESRIRELANPEIAEQFYSLVKQEVGSQGAAAQQGFMESVFNRAASRNQSLLQTITDAAYFPAASLRKVTVFEQEMSGYKRLLDDIVAGSNVSNYATGNASLGVGFAGGPQTFAAGGERFGAEGPDREWYRAMTKAASKQPPVVAAQREAASKQPPTPPTFAPPPLLAAPALQMGGIVSRLTNAWLGERGPEAIIPLSGGRRALGLLDYAARSLGVMRAPSGVQVSFAPTITINGNATEAEQRAMDTRLRDLAREFIKQFTAAQYQERRLSYQGGYG